MISFFAFWPQPNGLNYNLTVSGTSAKQQLAQGRTYRLWSNTDCYVRQFLSSNAASGNDTATVADIFVPARSPMVLLLDKYDSIAVVQATTGGILGICEMQNPL